MSPNLDESLAMPCSTTFEFPGGPGAKLLGRLGSRLAVDRLIEHARAMGANAIAGVRSDSSEIGNNMSEILAYGTAVTISEA
jgi:hypothetical protein